MCMGTRGLRDLLLFPAGLLVAAAQASPTAEEFRPCHRASATVLQRCLDQRPGGAHDERCWAESRRALESCYRMVRESHARHPPPKAQPASAALSHPSD